ncbi:Inner membrane protein ydcO [Kluyvera cryocrescens]|uniref:Inner membrane protein ydcO n=1 Tax=Kluyvera cryocrescens TaxID=580 RepID=A0A485CQ60_KLUCR|nr:Inner membrane protein ydcO [Kluyvera cryocrescens]
MLVAWLLFKALAPRYAVVAALAMGILVATAKGDVVTNALSMAVVVPQFIAPHFAITQLLSIGIPFFLVTMASQNAPGLATLQASGYRVPISPLIVISGAFGLLLAPFGVYSVCIAAITAAICQSPDAPSGSAKALAGSGRCGCVLSDCGDFRRFYHCTHGGTAWRMDPDAGWISAAGHARWQPVPVVEKRARSAMRRW